MKDVSVNEGRTVLFVSHNMAAVNQLCNKCIIINKGRIVDSGDVTTTINKYLASENSVISRHTWLLADAPGNSIVKLLEVYAHDDNFSIPENSNFNITKAIGITVRYQVLKEGFSFIHGVNIYNNEDINIFNSHDVTSEIRNLKRDVGMYEATMWIPGNLMSEGTFSASIALFVPSPFELFAYPERILSFSIIDEMKGDSARGNYMHGFPGYVRPLLKWTAKKYK